MKKRLLEFVRKFNKPIIFFASVLILMASFWFVKLQNVRIYQEQVLESQNENSFTAEYSQIDAIALSVDYEYLDAESEDSNFIIEICDEAGNEVWNGDVPVEASKLNSFDTKILLENDNKSIKLTKGEKYYYFAKVDNKQVDNVSIMLCGDKIGIAEYYFVVCCLVLMMMLIILVMMYKGINSFYLAFIGTMIILGIMNCTIVKPLCVPDEATHFAQSYEVSNRLLRNSISDSYVFIRESGVLRCSSDISIQNAYHFYSDYQYGNEAVNNTSVLFVRMDSVPLYCFLPGGIGITLSRFMNLPYQWIIALGRMTSIFFLSIMAVVAMKIYKPMQYAIAAICLLPSTVWLCTSYSYDVWNLSFIFIFVALCFKIKNQKCGIRLRDILLLLVTLVLFAPIKYVYITLGLAVLFIPFTQWKNRKLFIASIVSIIAMFIVMMVTRGEEALSYIFSSKMDTRGISGNSEVVSYTFSWVIHHPIDTVLVFVKTYIDKTEAFVTKGVTGEFYNSYVPSFISGMIIVVFALLLFVAMGKIVVSKSDRIKAVSIFIVGCLSVYVAFMFLYSVVSPSGIGTIDGMQGRYFVPFIILLPIAMKSDRVLQFISRVKCKYFSSADSLNVQDLLLGIMVLLNLAVLFSKFVGIALDETLVTYY